MKKLNILGTEYTVEIRNVKHDDFLQRCDGYCDKSSHRIVVREKDDTCELEDFRAYQKKCLRHEIIHAFLFESGLAENFEHVKEFGHEETMIDWIAIQFPKMLQVFLEADAM